MKSDIRYDIKIITNHLISIGYLFWQTNAAREILVLVLNVEYEK